jgi:hypothetical protein
MEEFGNLTDYDTQEDDVQFIQITRQSYRYRSKSAVGKKTKGLIYEDYSPCVVNTKLHHNWRDGSNSELDPQMDEITQGFTEIKRDPFKPGVESQ